MDVGIDITAISRFTDKDERFINYVLTNDEMNIYNTLSSNKKVVFVATRWACKEAIFKATQDNEYLKYAILNNEKGKPYILNHPEMKVSISHEGDTVIAIVIAE